MTQSKYVFLDRDGVVNHDSPNFIKYEKEWVPIPRSLEAIGLLTKNDYRIILISNQSGISRGVIQFANLISIHKKLVNKCTEYGGNIFSTYYCCDHPESNSPLRKPNPGMYLEMSDRLNIELSDVFSIGDSPRDIEASRAAGCKPLAVRTGNGEKVSQEMPDVEIFEDLYQAAEYIIDYDKQYILNI